MLKFQEFVQDLINQLQMRLGENHEIVLQKDWGINQVNPTCLSIKWDAIGKPVGIRLEMFYEMYTDGVSMNDILDYALYLLETAKGGKPRLHDTDYKSVKDNLQMMLVNYQANIELFNLHPHMLVLDLAVIFLFTFENTDTEWVQFIDNDQMKAWGVDVTQMYLDAYNNMRNSPHPIITPVTVGLDTDDIFPFWGEEMNDGYNGCIFPVHVGKEVFWQMCTDLRYGATAMLYEEKLYEFAMEHGCNIFILPSSIYEVLLAIDDGDVTATKFAETVKCINHCLLQQEDLLSNSIYYYDRLKRETSIAELGELELPSIKSEPVS